MSKHRNPGTPFWRRITDAFADFASRISARSSSHARADRAAAKRDAAAERARRMPPKGWKPGQPYIFETARVASDATESAAASSAATPSESEPSGAHFNPGSPDPIRHESGTAVPPTRLASIIGWFALFGRKKGPAKPPTRPRNFRLPGQYTGASAKPAIVLTRRELIVRNSLAVLSVLILGLVINIFILGNLQHSASQQQLTNAFRVQLSEATAPVSEGDFQQVLLSDGVPVALIDIPSIGVHEVIVEGTSSSVLKAGPGHRRDTILPGQMGVSVIMGRAAAYGGPFSRLQELKPGDPFSVITGQGKQDFEVIGLRYAGDPAPAAPKAGSSRIILETARGPAFVPTGVVRVDAQLTSTPQTSGKRQTTFATLAAADRELATDTRTIWALVFALQFLILIEVALVWAYVRVGLQRTWVVFLPLFLLAGLLVADQTTSLLPNLL